MPAVLRALILGSGFAGKGHALALRDAGVEVVGLVGRTAGVVEQAATELAIPYAGTDWHGALEGLRPDIVAIGTPGGAHVAPILAALTYGCHVLCDKPLAPTAAEARQLYEAARQAGVKTAYAASYRYQPQVLLARRLVAEGALGTPLEVECMSHYDLNPLIPFGWSHQLSQGGGRLNNNVTHKLALVLHILDGRVEAVCGEARNDLHRAPVVAGVHDFREREHFAPTPEEAAQGQWEEVDSDWSYTVLARIASPRALHPVSALFRHGGLQPRFADDYVALYGSEGALHLGGAYAQGAVHLQRRGGAWEEMAIPPDITAALPAIADDTQRNWTQLAREFVADIEGRGDAGYLTFRDGWIFQEAIDAVRVSTGWAPILPGDDAR